MLRQVVKSLTVLTLVCVLLVNGTHVKAESDSAESGGTLSLSEEEREFLAEGRVFKVGYVQDRIPISFKGENGELAGVSRYIFDAIEDISGLKFSYEPIPGGSITYQYLMSEGFDLVSSVEYNEENKGARGIQISDPYLKTNKVVVARNDFEFSYDAHLKVAISSGSQTIRKVLKESFPNYEVVDYDSIEDCFVAVKKGEADILILNQYVAEYWLYRPIYEDLQVIPVLGMDDLLCFSAVVPFDEEGNPIGTDGDILISIIDKAIKQMDEKVVDSYIIRSAMENRYSFTTADFMYRYRYPLFFLGVAFLVIIGLMVLITRLRIQSMEAKADAKAKSRFLSTMSHEVRTPLNGLIGLNYLMSHKLDDQEMLSKYLAQSTSTAHYLLSLVSDILDMSMLHNEAMGIDRKPLDLNVLISTVEAIVESTMAEKGLHFSVQTEIAHPMVIGDSVRIQQILLNLLDNARKFTPEGGSVCMDVHQEMRDGKKVCTRIDIRDTGKGMSEAFQANIFDAFAQERETVSRGDQGVGLGLSISHRLAKLMNGELTFVSEQGKGSTFTFSFEAEACDREETEKTDAGDRPGVKPRILVAEDNELNGEIMLDLLKENQYHAELAINGRVALQIFADSKPFEYGVILMDLLMPEMDGYEAAKAIRALKREDAKTVKIYACSANCTEEDRKRALAVGMDGFLAKPIDVDALLAKLSQAE